MLKRSQYARLWRELAREKSMVFMAGPRQCGKTTLAGMIAESFPNRLYFNWDVPTDKRRLLENPFFFESVARKTSGRPLIVLDEIHKYRSWKNYLKGVYDRFHDEYQFLVAGSGRLDVFQKGGDSMAGRYYQFHLWPLTLAELADRNEDLNGFLKDPLAVPATDEATLRSLWERLRKFSGFPEPYLAAKPATYRRWSASYHRRLVREDIRDLTEIKAVDLVESLFYLLPSRVGSPLSLTGLAEDLKVAYNTVANWLSIFERFYLTFSVRPWTASIARSIQKERKTYLMDYGLIETPGERFENMVALELFRAVSTWNDEGLGAFSLHFVRDKEKREVDFLISERRKPLLLVEAKLSDETPSPNLVRFQKILNVPAVQLTESTDGYRIRRNEDRHILVAPAWMWLPRLP